MRMGELGWLFRLLTMALAVGSGALAGCTPSHPPVLVQSKTARPTVAVARQDDLYQKLLTLERPAAPLSALPHALRQKLTERLESLGEAAKNELLVAQGPTAKSYPLLYLAAGGQDIGAYRRLYSTPGGSDELVQLHLPAVDFRSLLAIANEVAVLSARHVLRELAHDLAPGRERIPALLQDIASAARAVERGDIELSARLELVLKHPSTSHDLALAQLYARRLELSQTEQILARVPEDLTNPHYVSTRDSLDALRVALAPPAASSRVNLSRQARAFLALGRADSALKILSPELATLESDLGFATAYARAAAGGSACPLVLQGIQTPILCSAGWREVRQQLDFTRLRKAWLSGKGRGPIAIEEYLGLAHVVPMTYGLGAPGDANGTELSTALSELQSDAREAARETPKFEAIALMAESLLAALGSVSAGQGQRAAIGKAERSRLLKQVAWLGRNLGNNTWGQAAELGTLAILLQDENIAAELLHLELRILPEHLPTLAALRLWQMLADNDVAAFERSKDLLAQIVQSEQLPGVERSRWLLLWAEAAVQLSPGEKSAGTLKSIAKRLAAGRAPLSTRLRSALDLAGLHARAGEIAVAAGVLAPLVDSTPRSSVANRLEQELLLAATGYLMILKALAADGAARKNQGDQLEAFLVDVARKRAAPPTLQLWLATWRGEIAYQVARDACRGNLSCESRAARIRGISPLAMAETVGRRSAQLLMNGVLPVGGVEIKFQYQPDGRLLPHVALDTRFLVTHVPESISASLLR